VGQTLTCDWNQTSGVAVTSSGDTSDAPSFDAPSLDYNAPGEELVFEMIVNDGAQDRAADTVTITVTAPVDVTDPTVTLSGMPATVLPGDSVVILVDFSKAVTGLVEGDFPIPNGTAMGLSGSGTSCTQTIDALGLAELSVVLPADRAKEVALNGNLASNTLTAASGTSGITEAEIAEFLHRRANAPVDPAHDGWRS
jgi:hypothetical protein